MRSIHPARLGFASAATAEPLEPRRLLTGVSLERLPDVDPGDLLTAPVIANLDGDSHLDIVSPVSGTTHIEVMRGNGNGTFGTPTPYTVGLDPLGIAVADLNNDQANDIVTANANDNDVSVLLNTGDGALFNTQHTYPVGASPVAVAVADLNGDGAPDIVAANGQDHTVSVLLNNGIGLFGTQTVFPAGNFPTAIALGDVNGDGKTDIVVADEADDAIGVLLGNGNGTFQPEKEYFAGAGPVSIALADLNGDHKLDVVVADESSGGVSVLLGNGDGTFGRPTTFATGGIADSVAVADMNHDGVPDIVATNDYDNSVSVLIGRGNGTFAAAKNFGIGPDAAAVAVGDINGDGYPDVVTSNSANNGLGVLLNQPVTLPATPLQSPVNKATNEPLSPTLKFVATGAIEFRVIVATSRADLPTDPTFQGPVQNAVLDDVVAIDGGPMDMIGPGVLKRGTTYFWEVQGFDYEKSLAPFSPIRSFTTLPDTAPVVKKIANASITVGQKYSASGLFTDPDSGDSWTATVNYGDGSGAQNLALSSTQHFSLGHIYDSAGTFAATVVVTDFAGQSSTRHFTVTVGGKAIETSLISLLTGTSPSVSSIKSLMAQASPSSSKAVVTAQGDVATTLNAALASDPLDASDAKHLALLVLAGANAAGLTPLQGFADELEFQSLLAKGGRDMTLVTSAVDAYENLLALQIPA